jgi:hypothetical protein
MQNRSTVLWLSLEYTLAFSSEWVWCTLTMIQEQQCWTCCEEILPLTLIWCYEWNVQVAPARI